MPPASPTSSASRSSTSTSPPSTRTASSPSSCANTRPGERPTPTCCATPRSSSRPSSTTRSASAPSGSRPGTTRASGEAERRARFELLKGLDAQKDQSYFLHRLSQAQLARTLFPIGELAKTEVRRIAAEIGLPNARKKDSTGICFIGERPFREFLNRYLANAPGPIEDDRGRTIGEHVGLSFYTLGQRKGIGIGGLKDPGGRRAGGEHAPWFVAQQGPRAQRPPRRRRPRSSLAAVAPARRRRRQLDRRIGARRRAATRRRRAIARPTPRARCAAARARTRSSSSSIGRSGR